MNLTKDYLQTLFEYRDGNLYWKIKPNKPTPVGSRAGFIKPEGYGVITIQNKKYRTHALIYMMHHDKYPEILDHIDGNPRNNLISNLRECTVRENNRNTKLRKDNKSGFKGVSWHTSTKSWRVQVSTEDNKINKHFRTKEEAIECSVKLREEHYKEYARHE